MMSTLGTNKSLIVVGDSDALIAIMHEGDLHNKKIVETVSKLLRYDAQTVFPLTTIAETITTLRRKLNKPNLVAQIIEKITSGALSIENTDTEMLSDALKVFDPRGSKKKTIFDALVAATAKKLNTKVILSADNWYTKLGFTLAINL